MILFKASQVNKEYQLQLDEWLKGENYTDGLRLWKQRYGEDMAYKMLCLGASTFNREKMAAGLLKPLPEPEPETLKQKPAIAKKPGKVAVLVHTVEDLTENVDNLEGDLREVAGSVDDLEGNLRDVTDNIDSLDESVQEISRNFEKLNEKVESFLSARSITKIELPLLEKPEIPEKDPEEVKKWRETTYGLMNERTLLKQRLRDLPDPSRRADRMKTAFRILDITAELDRLFGQIQYWEQHGRVPANVPIEEQGTLYPKKYLNLRTYVSRTRKQLAETSDPRIKAQLEEKIKKYKLQMKEIEIEL